MSTPLKRNSSGARKMFIHVNLDEDCNPDAFKVMNETPIRGRSKRAIEILAASFHAGLHASVLASLLEHRKQKSEFICKHRELKAESNRVLRETMEKVIAFTADFNSTQQAHTRELTGLLHHFRYSAHAPLNAATPLPAELPVPNESDFDVSMFPSDLDGLANFGKNNRKRY